MSQNYSVDDSIGGSFVVSQSVLQQLVDIARTVSLRNGIQHCPSVCPIDRQRLTAGLLLSTGRAVDMDRCSRRS